MVVTLDDVIMECFLHIDGTCSTCERHRRSRKVRLLPGISFVVSGLFEHDLGIHALIAEPFHRPCTVVGKVQCAIEDTLSAGLFLKARRSESLG